jgi:hypothetical protein
MTWKQSKRTPPRLQSKSGREEAEGELPPRQREFAVELVFSFATTAFCLRICSYTWPKQRLLIWNPKPEPHRQDFGIGTLAVSLYD